MQLILPKIVGSVNIRSLLSLEEVGTILSGTIFGGQVFSGRDLDICEEIPAIIISPFLGMKVILQGYPGYNEEEGFNLTVSSWFALNGATYEQLDINDYVYHLLKTELKDYPELEILDE